MLLRKKFVFPTIVIITILLAGFSIFFAWYSQARQNVLQLAEASFIYQSPEPQVPQIVINSPVSGSRFNIKDEVKIEFSVTDLSITLNAGLDGNPVNNGDIIRGEDLAIGIYTLAVQFSSSWEGISSDAVGGAEVTFTVLPLVGIKGLVDNNDEFVNFIIEGLGVENIYDKNIGLIYHDKVNDTEIGLNSEDGSSSIGDYDEDNLPELRVDFNKAWIKDIFNTNPYAEFTLRLELNEGTVLNVSSADWESQDPSQLLAVGLKDGVAAISAIDVTGDATGEVNIRLRDEFGNVLTTEPLGVATNSSGNIWVSFSDRRIRMYNTCGEFQKIDGVNPYWTVSSTPDGLDYDGANLQYSSRDNRLYKINSITGIDEPIGIVSRRLSVDGIAPEPGTLYTTEEYTGYNPTGISGQYLCSAGLIKISKRLAGNSNFIQTLPPDAPIWTNEQNTPASCLGIVDVPDPSVIEGHVVYLSSTNGNVYKVRFVDKTTVVSTPPTLGIQRNEPGPVYSQSVAICGREQSVSGNDIVTMTWRQYFKVIPPPVFIEAFIVLNETFAKWQEMWNGTQWVRGFNAYPLASAIFNICTFDESWTAEQKFNNPILSTQLFTYPYDGPGNNPNSEVGTKIRVIEATNIIPASTFYYTGRYGDEGQSFGVGPAPVPDPIPIGYIRGVANESAPYNNRWQFLTGDGDLEILDQFTTSIPVPQGLAMGQLFPRPKVEMTAFRPQTEPFKWDERYIPEDEEESPGAGIRINGDSDNGGTIPDRDESPVNGEDDLIKVTLEVTLAPAPGCIEYVLKRSNSNIKVWEAQTKGTAILDVNDEQVITFSGDGKKTIWVENPRGGEAFLELQVRTVPEGTVINFDKIRFFSFTSIVIALGGEGEVPTDTDPPNTDHGVFNIAIDLYTKGYDVHMYDEDNVNPQGTGTVFDEVKSAVEKRSVTKVAIFGYSHGGGSTHDLTIPLRTIRPFTISYTAYIDAVRQTEEIPIIPNPPSPQSEKRRPIGTEFLLNYYQTPHTPEDAFLGGDAVHPHMSGDIEINVTDTGWGADLTHFTIDDHPEIRNGVIQTLIQRVPDR